MDWHTLFQALTVLAFALAAWYQAKTKALTEKTAAKVEAVVKTAEVIKTDIRTVRVATDGMKDALVASTERAALAEGIAKGRAAKEIEINGSQTS